MSASNYLPPYSADDRAGTTGDGAAAGPAARPNGHLGHLGHAEDGEMTYADFLGDEVED